MDANTTTAAAPAAAVAQAVREAIEQAHVTRYALARDAGIPRGTLYRRLDAPTTSHFTATELYAIARVLGVPPHTLLPEVGAA